MRTWKDLTKEEREFMLSAIANTRCTYCPHSLSSVDCTRNDIQCDFLSKEFWDVAEDTPANLGSSKRKTSSEVE
jgi:hypothetical protein